MKRKIKFMIILIILLEGIMLLMSGQVQAALQANGKSTVSYTLDNWMLKIRQMETTGQSLGLSDTIDETTLLSSAKTSNNLDIHMELNTEYGAMAILSASGYGNPNPITNGETTTGNKSGVYIYLNKEWVAGNCYSVANSKFKTADARYKNDYTEFGSGMTGDATIETQGWHSSGASSGITGKDAGLLRAYSGSIFSYYGVGTSNSMYHDANNWKSYCSRAVVVIGTGL